MNKITRYLALPSALMLASSAHAEGVFAQLYPPKPPAGMAFVRVLNPAPTTLTVTIANGPAQAIGQDTIASSYAIVQGNKPFAIHLNGKPAGHWQVAPDSFNSLVPQGDTFTAIADLTGGENALKAELRFYNLSSDCLQSQLHVADGGPALFSQIPPNGTTARQINPVRTALSANCGATLSSQWPLPQLQAGDHYALFLTGSAEAPQLRGQLATTDAYTP